MGFFTDSSLCRPIASPQRFPSDPFLISLISPDKSGEDDICSSALKICLMVRKELQRDLEVFIMHNKLVDESDGFIPFYYYYDIWNDVHAPQRMSLC